MKLRLFLRNSVRAGLKLFIIACCTLGCTASTKPSFLKEEIPQTIRNICKNEYKLDVIAKLSGRTLWIYLPLDNLLAKSEKPAEYLEQFVIEQNTSQFKNDLFQVDYLIKPIPEKKSQQDMGLDKKASEGIFNILQVVRRVLFSIDQSKNDTPLFFCIVAADIKNGFEIKETFYCLDLKKISYGLISQTEYQHRIIQETNISPEIIAETQGNHLEFSEITEEDFLAAQIQHRIKLKFQKPEVEKNADIDKEVLKIIAYTLNTYGFERFVMVEVNNLRSGERSILNQAAIRAKAKE